MALTPSQLPLKFPPQLPMMLKPPTPATDARIPKHPPKIKNGGFGKSE